MRQEPSIVMNEQGVKVRRWLAWGICTQDGTLAEATSDPTKARVWWDGGHRIINFVHDEPVADDPQGQLL